VEKYHDSKGIIWPESVAPFRVHLISLKGAESESKKVYEDLLKQGIEVLWDDREVSAGVKFADSDLIGIPLRIVVSPKTIEKDSVEAKRRSEEKTELVPLKELQSFLKV
jgi:prolyl-tRNA synthetase